MRGVSRQLHKELKRKPSEYLQAAATSIRWCSRERDCGIWRRVRRNQIFMGTDYPFPWTTTSVDHILNVPGLSDADKIAILGGNLVRLLGIPA